MRKVCFFCVSKKFAQIHSWDFKRTPTNKQAGKGRKHNLLQLCCFCMHYTKHDLTVEIRANAIRFQSNVWGEDMVTQLWTCTYKYTTGLFKWICKGHWGDEERDIKIREAVCGLKRLTFPFRLDLHRGKSFWACTKIYSPPNLIFLCLFSSSDFLSDQTKATLSRAVL